MYGLVVNLPVISTSQLRSYCSFSVVHAITAQLSSHLIVVVVGFVDTMVESYQSKLWEADSDIEITFSSLRILQSNFSRLVNRKVWFRETTYKTTALLQGHAEVSGYLIVSAKVL